MDTVGFREPVEPGTSPHIAPREWISPGVSMQKRIITGVGVAVAAALFFLIAMSQGATMLASTIIGVIFIGCFVWYLRIVAPAPFTIRLSNEGLTRAERGADPGTISWTSVAKVKEEVFKNGTSVSVTVYKRVGVRGLHRAWVCYRDDVPRFDELVAELKMWLPRETPWLREQVHE